MASSARLLLFQQPQEQLPEPPQPGRTSEAGREIAPLTVGPLALFQPAESLFSREEQEAIRARENQQWQRGR